MMSDKLDLEEEMGIAAPEAALAVGWKMFLGVAVAALVVLAFAEGAGWL